MKIFYDVNNQTYVIKTLKAGLLALMTVRVVY